MVSYRGDLFVHLDQVYIYRARQLFFLVVVFLLFSLHVPGTSQWRLAARDVKWEIR
jgi:hypothetical protein